MLSPKKTKYRKQMKGRLRGVAKGGTDVTFGEFGLQALSSAYLTARQIEAARIAMTRYTKRQGKIWIRVFPDKPITKRPAETRMGKGKGDVDFWAAAVRPGQILFELGNIPEDKAKTAFKRIAHKMPIKVRMVRRIHTV